MSTSNLSELQKRLNALQQQARNLREEVSSLQDTQHSVEVADASAERASEVLAITAASRSTGSTQRRGRGAAPQAMELPQEFKDDLVHKAGDTEASMNEHKKLAKEIEDLTRALDSATAKADEKEQEFVALSELAGADADGHSAIALGRQKQNEYQAVLKATSQAYEQRELLRAQMKAQSSELRRMSTLVEETVAAQAQIEEAQTVLREKQEHLEGLKQERNRLQRSVASKDKMLVTKTRGPTSEERIVSLNYDRRVALHELNKETEQIKKNEQAIRTRAMEIAKAEKRVEMVGDAVAGDGLSEEDRVDVELLESLMTEVSGLYKLQSEANTRMDFLDAEIEKLVYKSFALQRTTESTRKEMEKIEKEHVKYLQTIKKELSQEQKANDRDITTIEREIKQIRRRKTTDARRAQRSS